MNLYHLRHWPCPVTPVTTFYTSIITFATTANCSQTRDRTNINRSVFYSWMVYLIFCCFLCGWWEAPVISVLTVNPKSLTYFADQSKTGCEHRLGLSFVLRLLNKALNHRIYPKSYSIIWIVFETNLNFNCWEDGFIPCYWWRDFNALLDNIVNTLKVTNE